MKTSNKIIVAGVVIMVIMSVIDYLLVRHEYLRSLPYAQQIAQQIGQSDVRVINITGERCSPRQGYNDQNDNYKQLNLNTELNESTVRLSGDTLYVNSGDSRIYWVFANVESQIVNGQEYEVKNYRRE